MQCGYYETQLSFNNQIHFLPSPFKLPKHSSKFADTLQRVHSFLNMRNKAHKVLLYALCQSFLAQLMQRSLTAPITQKVPNTNPTCQQQRHHQLLLHFLIVLNLRVRKLLI